MKDIGKFISIIFVLLLWSISIHANVKLPSVLSDNMVIQQKTVVSIWGWADPGEKVTVTGNWRQPGENTVADEKGHWIIKLKSPGAGGPYSISVQGKNKIVLQNILCGEVWLASGQSNMEFPMKNLKNADVEIGGAQYAEIRLFQVSHTSAKEPQSDCVGDWSVCSPENVAEWSAAAYFFAREIHQELKVPVGIINSNKGGSLCEAWMQEEAIDNDSVLSSELNAMWEKWEEEYNQIDERLKEQYEVWKKYDENPGAFAQKVEKPEVPLAMFMIEREHKRPGALYNAMIAPLVPFTIKGVIWYQGESNVSRPVQYRTLFPSMIQNWRDLWRLGNFPFYFVQIAPYNYDVDVYFEANNLKASLLREAQTMATSLPNTGLVVTSDIGNIEDGHPKNKQDVGHRLALLALAKTYGFNDIEYSGPVYKSFEKDGNTLRIYFSHASTGLMVKGGKLTCFELAGSDLKYHEAEAFIESDTVIVYSKDVTNPVAVRFGWNITDEPNLFNTEGLPAVPFRTDTQNYFFEKK